MFRKRSILSSAIGLGLALCLGGSAFAADMSMGSGTDRYGGPAYSSGPNLAATVEFVQDGGGVKNFSFVKALDAIAGSALIEKEVSKLKKQYGGAAVGEWVKTWDFAVPDAVKVATNAGVTLPAPATLSGKELAVAMVKAGSTSGTFWTGDMLDHLISHKVHDQVMDDIDKAMSSTADANYHRITNQAMYDLAHALGDTSVKLASFH